MARRGRRQVLQLDDVSSSHSPRPRGFAPVRSEEATRKATNSLLSLVSYASDASSDEDSDNDSKAEEQHTPPSSSTKEDNNPGSIDGEPVLEIPLPTEAEPLRGPEPQEGAEPPKPAEPVKEFEPPPMVESMLDIPLPESSCPPPKQRSQPNNAGMESELANFFAEIESISTETVPPDTEEIPLPTTSSSSLATTPEPPTTVDSNQPADVDHGFIPRPDASVSKATEDVRPVSPVPEKVKATSSKSAYQSMFVKGASEFVKVDKEEEKKENGVEEEEEELPEEPVSEWQMVQDDSTGYYYYWNMGTNEVTWEIPPGYTQFLLLYKEYEERIAAIPKDKLLRLKEKKKQSDTSGRESSPAPSSSKSKKEKKHKKDKHRKEKPESTSSLQIGPQLPPMPAEDNGTDVKVMADQSDAKTADDVRTAASPKPSSEERKAVKTGENVDSAVDSTSVSVPQDVEAIFDEALSAVMESHVDSSRTDAPVDMFRDDDPSKEKSVVPAVTSSSVTGTSSAPPSLDAASVDSSKSVSAESSKTGSPAPADSDSAAVLATVSVSTSVVSSSSVVSSVSLSLRDSKVDNGGEGLVTNSGMNESVTQGEEEEDDLDMDFDDIDDVDRALEKALEKKKAELEKLGSRGEEDMVTSDSQPQSSSLPTHSSQSDAPEQNTDLQPAEAESAVSSSVKSTAASSPVAGPSSKSSSAASEDRGATADSSEARSESSRRKRSAAESSTKDESSKRREPVTKKTRLVVYDAAETDEESMDASEEVSTSPAPSGKTSGDANSVAEVVPTPPSESADISKEMADMANTACAKLAFLDVTVEGLSRLQTSLIALQTRMTDWQNGGLNDDYFYQRLKEVNDLLTQYESSAVPRGWTCQWDSDFRRYFYIHETTKRTQWEYPEPSPDDAPKAEERKPKKGKSSKKKRSKVIGPEPLPTQNAKTAGMEDNEAAVACPDGSVACPDGTTALQDGAMANQDGTAADWDGMEEDLDGVAMNREEADNQETWAANGEREKQASTSTSTSSDGPAHSEGMVTALQALFPGEPLPPGTELLLGLPPPPPPPLPASDDAAAGASSTTTNAEEAYVCADDSSDESSEKSADRGRERSSEEVLPNLDPDIDGEEMVEEEEDEEGGVEMERGGREEEGVPAMVVEDPAVISRPPQLRFPPAAAATSSAVAYVSSSSSSSAGMDSATLSSQPVLSAAPVLKTASSLPLPDSASSGLTASPQREDGHRRSPAPSQEPSSSSSSDRHKRDKPEKHKKKKREKLGSHTMSLKKKGVSNLVQTWQKVKKEVEKEERASQQRQAAIRQQLDEWKKGSS